MIFTKAIRDVYRFALYLSGDPALADDITSETFRPGLEFTGAGPFYDRQGYLLAIACNLWLRKARRYLRRQGLEEVSESCPSPKTDPTGSPAAGKDAGETGVAAEHLLSPLLNFSSGQVLQRALRLPDEAKGSPISS